MAYKSFLRGQRANKKRRIDAVSSNDCKEGTCTRKRKKRKRKRKPIINLAEWACIDKDAMQGILSHLNLRDKVVCVSMVCKGWNECKDIPCLFCDLSDDSGPDEADQMGELIEWVPYPASVTSIRIVISKRCEIRSVGRVLGTLAFRKFHSYSDCYVRNVDVLKSKKFLSDMSRLVLVGPKFGSLPFFFANNYGVGPALTSLKVDDIEGKQSTYTRDVFMKLLRNCSNLQVLELPASIACSDTAFQHGLIGTLAAIGPNIETRLRIFDLTMTTYGTSDRPPVHAQWIDMASIGRYCPELEVLKLPTVADKDMAAVLPASIQNAAMIPLPKLKTFSVGRILPPSPYPVAGPVYASTDTVSRVLSWLLAGMPAIEEFSFGHGRYASLSTDTSSPPALPGIGSGLTECPRTLRRLRFSHLDIAPMSLLTSGINPGTIESITLECCGEYALGALNLYVPHADRKPWTMPFSLGMGHNDVAYLVRNGTHSE